MKTPRMLALSALVAAAWCHVSLAQDTTPTPSRNSSVTTPSDRSPATSPSRTDRDTSTRAQSNAPRAASSEKLSRGERKFVEEMLEGGLAEVELGKLAQDKAQNGDIKKFGQRMVEDYSKAGDELKRIAEAKGIKIPAEPDRSHRRKVDDLQKLSGADFDKKYVGDMVKDHEHDVKEIQKMAKDAKDPEVKAFAEKTAPVLEEHLNQVRQLADATGSPRGGRSNKSAAVNPGRDANASSGSSTRAASGNPARGSAPMRSSQPAESSAPGR